MEQYVVQQIQNYVSSKTKSFLVKVRNNQNKNSGFGRLTTTQKTYTLLLDSQNILVVSHAEKLVSLGTNRFWYGSADK